MSAPRTAGGEDKKRTCLVDKRGPPGLAASNLLDQLRGHPGDDKNCKCCVGWVLKDGSLVRAREQLTRKGVRMLCWKAKPFSQHTFNAAHFAEMAKNCTKYLPFGHAEEILDFAMGYNCIQNGEVQSIHWSPETVTILVCIVYRHANMRTDGKESTPENPIIVKDFVFGISDDRGQNARVS